MPQYIITHCTAQDGPELSCNNMSAYWQDANWVYMWKNETLSHVIQLNAARYPRILLRNRDTARHLKALDPATGELLGYARWILPETHCQHQDGSPVWPDGQVPDITGEARAQIEAAADLAQTQWHPIEYTGADDLDAVVTATKKEWLARKEYVVLDYIAVHPRNQGKGVGAALVRYGLDQLRCLGLDIFLQAFESGFKLYEKVGFKLLGKIVQDASRLGGTENYEVRFMEYKMARA